MRSRCLDIGQVIFLRVFGVFLRRAEISAKRASPPSRASPAHVIGPLNLRDSILGRHFNIVSRKSLKIQACFIKGQKA